MIRIFKKALLLLFISCSTFNFKKHNSDEKMSISFGSIYEDEKLTLSINDSVFYLNTPIKTNSLGTDPKKNIQIETDSINLKGTFNAVMDAELDFKRSLEIDTILFKRNGRLIIIGANYNKYHVSQQDKPFIVE